jgi:hypothetical protein
MSEKDINDNKGNWLIQFDKGTGNQIIVGKVFHQHDNGTIFSTYYNINEESSNIVMCEYVCKSCKKRTSLNNEYLYPAGDILS